MARTLVITIWVLFTVTLLGCEPNRPSDPNEWYAEGRKAGVEEGRAIGIKEGYDKGLEAGFEKSYPGTPTQLQGIALKTYKVLVWGGALKVCLSIGLALIVLIGHASGPLEAIGRVLFGVLGSVATILAVTYLKIAGIAESLFLLPAASSLFGQLFWISVAATTVFWAFEGMYVFLQRNRGPLLEAWVAFFLSSVLTFMLPVLTGLFGSVPDISKYFAANILAGTLVGGVYYLAAGLVTGKFSLAFN
ncbi:MAG: hypothetical protein WC856_27940 [Methylococcaceae bacterium]|jgi:hypothetical protein